jgi:hypothetical protein
MMYDPYNNSRKFKPWAGEDCSYLHAYAAAPAHGLNFIVMAGMVILSIALQQLVAEDDDNQTTTRTTATTRHLNESKRAEKAIHSKIIQVEDKVSLS